MVKKYPLISRLRTAVVRRLVLLLPWYYRKVWGAQIGKNVRISFTTKIDKTNPRGVVIGDDTALAFGAAILTHDFVNSAHRITKIGSCCFIGARSIIMPGVSIGDHCIIGSGAVVLKDVPSNSVVLGNPGRVMERGIKTGIWGMKLPDDATDNSEKFID